MKIERREPDQIEVVIAGSREELGELIEGLRANGRKRTTAQSNSVEALATMLADCIAWKSGESVEL